MADDDAILMAVSEIQAALRGLPGVVDVPKDLPDKAGGLPFVVVYPSRGTWKWNTTEDARGLHIIVAELHVDRAHLSIADAKAKGMSQAIPIAIFRAFKAGQLPSINVLGDIDYEYGPLSWAGTSTFGYTFFIRDVKTRVSTV